MAAALSIREVVVCNKSTRSNFEMDQSINEVISGRTQHLSLGAADLSELNFLLSIESKYTFSE